MHSSVFNSELLGGEITPKFHISPKILKHVISNSMNAYISPSTGNISSQCCCSSINTDSSHFSSRLESDSAIEFYDAFAMEYFAHQMNHKITIVRACTT